MALSPGPEVLELPADHPGVSDHDYRARRAAITQAAASYRPPDPIPIVHYTAEEDEVWRIVSSELATKHRRYACRAYLDAAGRLVLPTERVPQLAEVDARLSTLSNFRIRPVPGLVAPREFYGALADRVFLSTQYIRHHSVPFYTPEPDIVHEIVGHANMLGDLQFAALYQAAGEASRRVESDAAREFFSRVFWFTLEFGVLWEDDELRAYGAGLLSSFGEIEAFRSADVRPWDIGEMGTRDYDITRYQPVLFAAASFDRMVDDLGGFFDAYDEDAYTRLTAAS
jgi:phenylalanine-4-hydroxylase